MRGKLTESVRLLKELKEQKDSAETEKQRDHQELLTVRNELFRREQQEKTAEKEQSTIHEKLQRDRSSSSGVMGFQDFLQNSPRIQVEQHLAASNTLKEIAELKTEIIKLTTSLRTIKVGQSPPQKEKAQTDEKEVDESMARDKSMERKWWKNYHNNSK
jgi:hypothetical protein